MNTDKGNVKKEYNTYLVRDEETGMVKSESSAKKGKNGKTVKSALPKE